MRRALICAALALAACVPSSSEDPARFYSLGDIRDLARSHGDIDGIPADGLVALAGQPIPWRSPPYAAAPVLERPDRDGIPVFPAFAEGKPAAYYTTEIWYDRSPLWAQPEYVPVTEWDPQDPEAHRLPGSSSIWSVGPESSFYSPYWVIEYVVVPASTDPATLTTVKSVLDPGYPIHPGPLKLGSLVPSDMVLASPDGGAPVRPFNGDALGPVEVNHGWVEGEWYQAFDFGVGRFTVHGDEVVDETPIYVFASAGPTGEFQDLGLPHVAGVGPAGTAARARPAPGNVPSFGGLWRIYFVELPQGAAVFVPPELADLKNQLRADGVSVPDLSPEVASDPRAPDYALRVAQDPSCFAGADAGFPDGCVWLDSQSAVEGLVPPQNIHRSELTATCPLVEYLGQPVPN